MQSALTQENIGALVNWCRSHQYRPDIAKDEMFVLPGAVLPETLAWEGEADIRVIFVLSTKKLLKNAVLQQESNMPTLSCSDATYNLLANKWPTLIMGTLDWQHKFRTVSVGCSSHQDERAFELLFLSTKAGIVVMHSVIYSPVYTLQDGAREIYNASKTVFTPKQILSCYYHCQAAIFKKKHEFLNKDSYQVFKKDTQILHASQSPVEFHEGAKLLVEKWDQKEPVVMAWFDDEYFKFRQTHYASLTPPGKLFLLNVFLSLQSSL